MFNKRFKLFRLANFVADMIANHRTVGKFDFTFASVIFSCLVCIDCDTGKIEIIIGGKAINFFCILPVDENYSVPSLSDEDFFDLRCKLELKYNGGTGFNSFAFLRILNENIPDHYTFKQIDPCDYGKKKSYVKSLAEEDSKVYFCYWLEHGEDGRQARNIEKTRIMTGSDKIARVCKRFNISSCWTDNPEKAKAFELPPHYDEGV